MFNGSYSSALGGFGPEDSKLSFTDMSRSHSFSAMIRQSPVWGRG